MGKRTSVYLSDELDAALKASGMTIAEHLARSIGLAAAPRPAVALAARRPRIADCPHPKARVFKGLCGACGTNAG